MLSNANGDLPHIILASSSPRRQSLLRDMGLTFEIMPSDVDESVAPGTSPDRMVEILADRKARAVADRVTGEAGASAKTASDTGDVVLNTLVIGSDTIVVLNGEVLGKPSDEEHAKTMLTSLQGRRHTVYTGLCVLDAATGMAEVGHSQTDVFMRSMTADEIEAYIATGEPMDKAGSYAIQGFGATLVERIEGDYFTVVGLPVRMVAEFLGRMGVRIF